jgi:hypothetical protein
MSWLGRLVGAFIEWGIRIWIHVFGKKLAKADAGWLSAPMGPPGRVGPGFYDDYARANGFEKRFNAPDTGLLPDFGALTGPAFDAAKITALVRDFYERTVQYKLDAWSQWSKLFKPFAWMLISFVSRRMDQLNLPVDPLDTSRGMSSDVIQLAGAGRVEYTGWLRRMQATGDVVYAGLYTVGQPPIAAGPCVKVVFPVPRGSVAVFLRPELQTDGSLKLVSSGRGYGDAGFYRMIELNAGYFKVRYIKAIKEVIHVYVDGDGVLRTDHTFSFFKYRMLTLHYKITPVRAAA